MVDAITTQVVRNRIGSLMQEMHYHFYRSGYSTIIRELRDFSCVILDRHGGLLVAPPMFFHAPVYRHLVAKIFALHGDDVGDGDMFVCNHPYDGGLPHVSDMAFVSPIIPQLEASSGSAGSIGHKANISGADSGSTSRKAKQIFQEGLFPTPVKYFRAASQQTISSASHPRQQPAARIGARRHAYAHGGDPDGHVPLLETYQGSAPPQCSSDAFAALLAGTAAGCSRRHQGAARWRSLGRRFHGQRRRRARPPGAFCLHGARARTATSLSISPRATARPRGRSICGRR